MAQQETQTDDYRALVRELVFGEHAFVRLTLKGIVRGAATPWQKIVVRPVQVRGRDQLQFSYFDAKRDVSKNYYGGEALAHLDEALDVGFSVLVAQTADEDVQIQITKKGKALVHRHRHAGAAEPSAEHNRAKALPLPAESAPWLQAIGITNAQGQIKPSMQGKFAQINEFIKLVEATVELDNFGHTPINVLDFGCGSSYLTFGLYTYLNERRGLPARLVGVDSNTELIAKCNAQAAALEYGDLCFTAAPIIDFAPADAPDLVVALHACDTATDDAIAQTIRHGARMLVCAPCCHHHLNEQLDIAVLRPIMRHGILKQRMGDILTDSFRALILRIMGYRAEVIEFVAAEHTAKNLMIRAVKIAGPGDQQFVREYHTLKQFWGVTPYLETLLGEPFQQIIAGAN